MVRGRHESPRRLVGSPHRAAEGASTPPSPAAPTSNTSTTAPTRTNRASASPARSPSRACRRTASCPPTRTSCSPCRHAPGQRREDRDAAGRFRRHGAGPPAHRRRAPDPEGRQHPLHQPATLARRLYRRRRPLPGRRDRAPRRHPDRPGVRHPLPHRPRRRRPRSLRGAVRRADRLRLQLRRPCRRS